MMGQDCQFLQSMLNAGAAEEMTGRMAIAKTKDRTISDLASLIIQDHEDIDREIQVIAQSKGVRIEEQVTDARSNEMQALQQLSGNVFDQEYVKYLIKHQSADLREAREEALELTDNDVKQLAKKITLLLDAHIDQAKQIQEEIRGKSQIKSPKAFNEPFIVHPSAPYSEKRSKSTKGE